LLYRTKPNRQLKLFGLVLGRLESERDGQLVWSALYDADYAATGATVEDVEGLSDLLSQSASAELMLLFRDMGERTKISVRTREGGPDATQLTGLFGGGGHARASGATLALPINEAIPAVLEAARQQLDERRG
jgi:phosphoesterase RecJ-like protein